MLQLALLAALVIPAILFILAQQNTLKAISPENREISPGSVWLQLIPVFGLAWEFIVVTRIARSISKELTSRIGNSILDDSPVQIKETNEAPTYTIGLTYCILTTLGVIINYSTKQSSSYLALSGSFLGFIGMVCLIVYWVKLVNAKNKLIGLSIGVDTKPVSSM